MKKLMKMYKKNMPQNVSDALSIAYLLPKGAFNHLPLLMRPSDPQKIRYFKILIKFARCPLLLLSPFYLIVKHHRLKTAAPIKV